MKTRINLGDLTPRERLFYAGHWAQWTECKEAVLILGGTGNLTAIAIPDSGGPFYVHPEDVWVLLDEPPVWQVKKDK